MSKNPKRDQQSVSCSCLACGAVYLRVWTPGVRFPTYDRCAACALAAYRAEQAADVEVRVLH